jgi:hypothetical protein
VVKEEPKKEPPKSLSVIGLNTLQEAWTSGREPDEKYRNEFCATVIATVGDEVNVLFEAEFGEFKEGPLKAKIPSSGELRVCRWYTSPEDIPSREEKVKVVANDLTNGLKAESKTVEFPIVQKEEFY